MHLSVREDTGDATCTGQIELQLAEPKLVGDFTVATQGAVTHQIDGQIAIRGGLDMRLEGFRCLDAIVLVRVSQRGFIALRQGERAE